MSLLLLPRVMRIVCPITRPLCGLITGVIKGLAALGSWQEEIGLVYTRRELGTGDWKGLVGSLGHIGGFKSPFGLPFSALPRQLAFSPVLSLCL